MSFTEQVKLSGFLEKSPPGVSHPDGSVKFAKWEQRYFELTFLLKKDVFLLRYYNDERKETLKGTIDLGPNSTTRLFSDLPSNLRPHVFCLMLPKRKFFCSAASASSKDKWVAEISNACPHLINTIIEQEGSPKESKVKKAQEAAYDTLTHLLDQDKDNGGDPPSNPSQDEHDMTYVQSDGGRVVYDKCGMDAFNNNIGSYMGQINDMVPVTDDDANLDDLLWGGDNRQADITNNNAHSQIVHKQISSPILKADPRSRK